MKSSTRTFDRRLLVPTFDRYIHPSIARARATCVYVNVCVRAGRERIVRVLLRRILSRHTPGRMAVSCTCLAKRIWSGHHLAPRDFRLHPSSHSLNLPLRHNSQRFSAAILPPCLSRSRAIVSRWIFRRENRDDRIMPVSLVLEIRFSVANRRYDRRGRSDLPRNSVFR